MSINNTLAKRILKFIVFICIYQFISCTSPSDNNYNVSDDFQWMDFYASPWHIALWDFAVEMTAKPVPAA